MQLYFGYGNGEQIVNVPDEQLLGVLTANEMAHARTGSEAVAYALEIPLAHRNCGHWLDRGKRSPLSPVIFPVRSPAMKYCLRF